ncbi:MAG: hypothetical protein AAF705_00820, partial [Bacteroidota bacterium]
TNRGLANSLIEVIQDRRTIASTQSDSLGRFEVLIPEISDIPIYLRAQHESYPASWTTVNSDGLVRQNVAVILSNETGELGITPDTINAGAAVLLSGQLVDKQVNPVSGRLIVYETGELTEGYAFTDSEGFFVMDISKESTGQLVALERLCNPREVLTQVTTGVEDVELGVVTVQVNEQIQANIQGQVLDCEDQPYADAIVLLQSFGIPLLRTVTDESGNYEFNFDACQLGTNISIDIFDADGFSAEVSETIVLDNNNANYVASPRKLCPDTSTVQFIEVKVGELTQRFRNLHYFVPASLLGNGKSTIYPDPSYDLLSGNRTGLTLVIATEGTGEELPIVQFNMEINQRFFFGGERYEGTSGTATVTKYTGDLIEGTFEANVLDAQIGMFVPVTGTFIVETE